MRLLLFLLGVFVFFFCERLPPRSTTSSSSAASDVDKRLQEGYFVVPVFFWIGDLDYQVFIVIGRRQIQNCNSVSFNCNSKKIKN